ncbi:MAG: dihydrofolate reductase [Muribaculaceae bacterium]|nr:dihydrofolate reductase [Muribaculaceae bacterium]
MTQISIIVAITRDNAIGRGGDLLYHISEDLKRFKAITMGHPIIMGRKTFESFPNGALPGRRNIVITKQTVYTAPGIEIAGSLQEAFDIIEGCDEAFVIGGGEIYRQAMPFCSRLYLTEIDANIDNADTYFPSINDDEWIITEQSDERHDPRTGVSYRFTCLSRK